MTIKILKFIRLKLVILGFAQKIFVITCLRVGRKKYEKTFQ